MMQARSGDYFGRLGANKSLVYLIALVVILLAAMVASIVYTIRQNGLDQIAVDRVHQARGLAQRLAIESLEAAHGQSDAMAQLRVDRDRFQRNLDRLRNGDPDTGLPPAPASVRPALNTLSTAWASVRGNVNTILAGGITVTSVDQSLKRVDRTIPKISAIYQQLVWIGYEQLVDQMVRSKADNALVVVASRQSALLERIQNNLRKIFQGGQSGALAADRFGRDITRFSRVQQALLNGAPGLKIKPIIDRAARADLLRAVKLTDELNRELSGALARTSKLFRIRDASTRAAGQATRLSTLADRLATAYDLAPKKRVISSELPFELGGVALIMLGILGWGMKKAATRQYEKEAAQNERNQQAILRLLDELSTLADGDLTVHATVTEDMTGAIADSINYAVDAMRGLVSTINETTVQVSSAAQETQATAMHLAEASDRQAQQITGASSAINEMTASIEHVSRNASESAEVAQQSVLIAHNG
ncbi:MAG TPA: methyl-accepting chemotaxis protein, partial [Chromatiales bacterium]|nr:methyl-accepting chemotaxis protein [Chromatiales bacterium]